MIYHKPMSKLNQRSKKVHSSKVKFQVVLETIKGEQNQSQVARSYGINSNLITRWKEQFLSNGHLIFEAANNGAGKEQEQTIHDLEQIIGKQTVEIAILKKFLGHYRSR
jgi:transposase-like protein